MTESNDLTDIIRVDTIQPIDTITNTTKIKNWIPVINNAVKNQTITSSMGNVYFIEKNINQSFDDAFDNFVSKSSITIKLEKNDVVIVRNLDADNKPMEQSAYVYNGTDWIACTGFVDASKVVMYNNIQMAGNYTSVGNKTKDINDTATFLTKGMSVQDIFSEIFTKREQPYVINPSLSDFDLSEPSKQVEVGTYLSNIEYTNLVLDTGLYQFEPNNTNVKVASYLITRITNKDETVIQSSTDLNETVYQEEVDNKTRYKIEIFSVGNDAPDTGFILGDNESDTNSYSFIKYKASVTYTNGDVALDNMGKKSNPEKVILTDTLSEETTKITCYRNYFYGCVNNDDEITSNLIRTLTPSNKSYKTDDSFILTIPSGTKKVIIACPDDKIGPVKIINIDALNADMMDNFSKYNESEKIFSGAKLNIDVEGANGYVAKKYNIWYYKPAVPYSTTARLIVKLG